MQAPDPTFLTLQSALAGEYSLERELGRGGMGIVFLAREVVLDRLVAIKALPAKLATKQDIHQRFLREAKTAAALSHPNVVGIHTVGEAEGIPYFVMGFVRGETLGERLRSRGPVAPTLLTRILHDVALALGYAHGRGVVHRDVKPDNILIEEGSERALVTDFGIAHFTNERLDAPAAGTAHFASPEQLRGEPLDGRSDIYSLGIVAFLASTGRFPSLTDPEAAKLSEQDAAALRHLPAGLVRVIERCLYVDPSRRFANAEQMATELNVAASPARTALPVPLRAWLTSETPLLGTYQISSTIFSALALHSLYMAVAAGRMQGTIGYWLNEFWVYFALAVGPVVPISLYQLLKTQRILGQGYTIGDLRLALRTWVAERREELAFDILTGEPALTRLMRWLPATLISAVPAIALIGTALGVFRRELAGYWYRGAIEILLITIPFSFLIIKGMGVPVTSPQMRRTFAGKVRSWLWNSRFGGWLARAITPNQRGVPESHFRPTELALGLAVEELFVSLPSQYRSHVGDLPLVAARLTNEASTLRQELQRLEEARVELSPTDAVHIDPMVVRVSTRLGKTVSTMEKMRLELLRLHGGADDTRALTTSLDLARQMIDNLVRLREAEKSIDPTRSALSLDLHSPSPA